MCAISGQLEHTEVGRCVSCMNYAQELVPCPECQLQLCQQCVSPDQHDPCCLPWRARFFADDELPGEYEGILTS